MFYTLILIFYPMKTKSVFRNLTEKADSGTVSTHLAKLYKTEFYNLPSFLICFTQSLIRLPVSSA